jgi:hypothetical protein
MNKEDAVFYSKDLPQGYNCFMPVVKYARERIIKNGAIIVIDMNGVLGQERYDNKSQLEYMLSVFNELKNETLTINCVISADKKPRIMDFLDDNTEKFSRPYSGPILRGSVSEGPVHKGKTLEEVIKNKNPLIVMGCHANFCVQSSIFGSKPPNQLPGLLDKGKTVITSRALLEPVNSAKLEQGYGILAGQ